MIAPFVELLPLMAQVMKLLLPLRTAAGAKTLAVGVQCVVQFPQEPTHRVGADPQSQLGQFPTDGSQAFAGPHATTTGRIPGRILPEQGAKALQDFGRFFSTAGWPPPLRRTRPRTT